MSAYQRIYELFSLSKKKKSEEKPDTQEKDYVTPNQLLAAKTAAQTKQDREDFALKQTRRHEIMLAKIKAGYPVKAGETDWKMVSPVAKSK